MKPFVKISDVIIILAVASFTFFSAYSAYLKPQGHIQVLIKGQISEYNFPIGAAERVSVPGPLGHTIVRIGDNQAWIESSPCQNQTCVAQGHAARQGQWAACLPNHVLLIIQGAISEDDLDAVVW